MLSIVIAIAAIPGLADSMTIPAPTAGYISSTTLIDINGITDGSTVDQISNGTLVVNFGSSMSRLTVGNTWGTWNTPPAAETATPPVLYSNGSSDLVMTLSVPQYTFGFEAQPDLSDVESLTAAFLDSAGNTLLSITRDVSGNGGALLFAGNFTTPVSKVELSDSAGDDFAIANVRFSSVPVPVPEPSTIQLMGLSLIVVGFWKVRRRSGTCTSLNATSVLSGTGSRTSETVRERTLP